VPPRQSGTLTEAELRIMNVLWVMGSGTVQQVLDSIIEKPVLAYNSVLTTIRVLEKKRYLKHLKDGRAHVYTPLVGQKDATRSEIRRLVTIFRELRAGVTADGKTKLKSPSGTLSTAEAISVVNQGLSLAAHFGDGSLRSADLAGGLTGAVVKDPVQDKIVWQEYLETVMKERDGWKDLYRACRESN